MKRINVYKSLKEAFNDIGVSAYYLNDVTITSPAYATILIKVTVGNAEYAKKLKDSFCERAKKQNDSKTVGQYDIYWAVEETGGVLYLQIEESSNSVEYNSNLSLYTKKYLFQKGFVRELKEIPSQKNQERYDLVDIELSNLIPTESIISVKDTEKSLYPMQFDFIPFRHIFGRSPSSNFVKMFNRRTFSLDKKSPRILKCLREFGFEVYVTSWEYMIRTQKGFEKIEEGIDTEGRDIFDDNMNLRIKEDDGDAVIPTLYMTEGYTPIIIEDIIEKSLQLKELPEFVQKKTTASVYKTFYQLNYAYADSVFAILAYLMERPDENDNHYFSYRIIMYKKGSSTPITDTFTEPIVKQGDSWLSVNFHYTVKGYKGIPTVTDMLKFEMKVMETPADMVITVPSINILKESISTRIYKSNDLKYAINKITGRVRQITDDILQNSNMLTSAQKEKLLKTEEVKPVGLLDCITWVVKRNKLTKKELQESYVYKDSFKYRDSKITESDISDKIMIKFSEEVDSKKLKKDLALKSIEPFTTATSRGQFTVKFNGVTDSGLARLGNLYDILVEVQKLNNDDYKDSPASTLSLLEGTFLEELDTIKNKYPSIFDLMNIKLITLNYNWDSNIPKNGCAVLTFSLENLQKELVNEFHIFLKDYMLKDTGGKAIPQIVEKTRAGVVTAYLVAKIKVNSRNGRSLTECEFNYKDLLSGNLLAIDGNTLLALGSSNEYRVGSYYKDLFKLLGIELYGNSATSTQNEEYIFDNPTSVLGQDTNNIPQDLIDRESENVGGLGKDSGIWKNTERYLCGASSTYFPVTDKSKYSHLYKPDLDNLKPELVWNGLSETIGPDTVRSTRETAAIADLPDTFTKDAWVKINDSFARQYNNRYSTRIVRYIPRVYIFDKETKTPIVNTYLNINPITRSRPVWYEIKGVIYLIYFDQYYDRHAVYTVDVTHNIYKVDVNQGLVEITKEEFLKETRFKETLLEIVNKYNIDYSYIGLDTDYRHSNKVRLNIGSIPYDFKSGDKDDVDIKVEIQDALLPYEDICSVENRDYSYITLDTLLQKPRILTGDCAGYYKDDHNKLREIYFPNPQILTLLGFDLGLDENFNPWFVGRESIQGITVKNVDPVFEYYTNLQNTRISEESVDGYYYAVQRFTSPVDILDSIFCIVKFDSSLKVVDARFTDQVYRGDVTSAFTGSIQVVDLGNELRLVSRGYINELTFKVSKDFSEAKVIIPKSL
jgi:hypothetical protein